MKDNARKLYDALSQEYDLGTYEQFSSDIQDEAKRKKLYDATSEEYDYGDYNSFSSQLGFGGTASTAQSEVKEEGPEKLRGFWANFKESSKGLWAGLKGYAGEQLNIFTGSSREEQAALNDIYELEAQGLDPVQYIADKEDAQFESMYGMSKADFLALDQKTRKDLVRQYNSSNAGIQFVSPDKLRQMEREQVNQQAVQEAFHKALELAGGDYVKAKAILKDQAEDKTLGDALFEDASETLSNLRQSEGFAGWLGNLAPQMIPSATALALNWVTKGRAANLSKWIGYGSMGGLTLSTAGMSMIEARNAGATNLEVWTTGIADGLIEIISEKIPFDRITGRVFSSAKAKLADGLADSVSSPKGRKELEELLVRANEKLGGKLFSKKNVGDWLLDTAYEAGGEFFAEALQTITPMIYENPEDYPTLAEVLANGWEGAKAGLVMGSVLGGASKGLEHSMNKERRQQQGYVDVAQIENENGDVEVVEVVGLDPTTGKVSVLHDGELEQYDADKIGDTFRFSYEEFENARLMQLEDESIDQGTVNSGQVEGMRETVAKDIEELRRLDPNLSDESIEDLRTGRIVPEKGTTIADAVKKLQEDSARLVDLENAKAQEREAKKATTRQNIEQSVGQQFWITEENNKDINGNITYSQSVEEIVYADGRIGYVVGYDDLGNLAMVYTDGTKGFTSREEIVNQMNSGEVVSDTPMGLDAYLDSKVDQENAAAEHSRMSEEYELNVQEMMATHPQWSTINLGTEEAKIEVPIIAPPTKDGVIVQMPDGTTPMLRWEDVAHAEKKEIKPRTDAQNEQSIVDQYKVAYTSPVRTQDQAPIAERDEVIKETTPATPLPTKADGSVDQTALWNADPVRWAKWNDEQRQDGGVNSLGYINGAIAKESAALAEMQAAYEAESDFDARDAMEAEINKKKDRLDQLTTLQTQYVAAQQAAAAPVVETAPVQEEAVAPRVSQQMSEEEKAQMDAQHQARLEKAKSTAAKREAMQAYVNEISQGSVPMTLISMDGYEQVMKDAGCTPNQISQVRFALEEAKNNNESVPAFYVPRVGVFAFIENIPNIEQLRLTYIHERQHRLTSANNLYLNAILQLNLSQERLAEIVAALSGSHFYDQFDDITLADEIISYAMERAYTYEDFSVALQELGIEQEIIDIITELDNEQRSDNTTYSSRRRGRYDLHDYSSEQGNRAENDRNPEAVSGGLLGPQGNRPLDDSFGRARSTGEGAEVASENNAVPFRIVGEPEDNLSNETKHELADKGLVMEGGVIMSDDYAELKHETGYLTPIEEGATTDDVRFAVVTMPGWKQNYLKYQDAEERVVRVLEAFADRITANELVNGVVAQGKHKSSKKTKDGRLVSSGPLRSNISYVVTFDLDTSCPRTFQYLNYVKRIERRIGRPLTQIECIQLNEMMRMYGQQIPCVYCYAENKRQAMKQYFNNYIESRHAVLTAETDEEALKHMYGHEAEGTDPKTVLTEAAYKVFVKWRKNPKGTYNPTMRVLWHQYDQARNSVLSLLDMRYAEGSINTDAADETLSKIIAGELGVSNKTAIKAIEEIVVEWKWNTIEGQEHDDFTRMDEDDLWANENALEVWRDMTLYAKSASGAKNVNRYVPYTDELKNVDQATRDYINGMGGLRMHSTNDFRIDYVFDYFQFLADMAAAKMFGHTYTKSPEFVRIFGNSGYKINMSIAAYQDENGVIRPNVDEGFDWNEAKELRRLFPHAGTMLMATSDEQLQMALDSEWIDMCIPFHHSGLPKAVWYNMRLWTDYTSVQNERYFNNDERIAMLAEAGVELPKKISTENVEEIFNEHFGIKVLYGKSGKRVKPHFLPGPTIVDGVDIPGHNNDHKRYLELCKEYGVKPRFEGIKVKDNTPEGGGRIVDITEHPRYMILVKETARTDTPQTAIQFNFDQPSEALGGKTPMDYAFDELEARAMAESDLAGGKVKDIYTSLKQDQFGIVDQFLNTIIKHKEETGEDYPMDYLTPESREWFLVQRKAFEEAFKDIETIPYHRNEYDEQGNLTKGKGLEREEPIDLVAEAERVVAEQKQKEMQDGVALRVIGENETPREFLQKEVDAYRSRFKEVAPITLVDINSKSQMAHALGVQETDLTDEDMRDIKEDIEKKNIWGGYGVDSKEIAIFVREKVLDSKRLEMLMMHESIHALTARNKDFLWLGQYMWVNAKKDATLLGFRSQLAKKEPKNRWYDEMAAYVISLHMENGTISELESLLDAANRDRLNDLLNELGYDKESETAARDTAFVLRDNGYAEVGSEDSQKKGEEGKERVENERPSVSFRITPEQDKAYMDAVNAGDMEAAQRMVLEAAKLAMPNTKVVDEDGNPKVVYHGSTAMFTVFDKSRIGSATGTADGRGFYFTTDRDYALGYKTSDGQLFEVFLNIDKPLSYDKKTITKAQLRKILKEADRVEYEQGGEHYMLSNYANYNDVGIDAAVNEAANLEYDYADNDVELVGSLIGGSGSFDLIMDAVKKVTGKSGMIAPKDNGTIHYVVTDPSKIKSAEPVTYDNDGNVIPLSERFNPENEDIRFRIANDNQAIFVSNAAKAVEAIKQEKATPEQWLKMIEKSGGLKAGEDKWMGLSDWLKASEKKTLTKQEVLDFINENMIRIEEQHYGFLDPDEVEEAAMGNLIAKYGQDFVDRFFGPAFIYEEGFRGPYIAINDPIEAKDLYYEETGNELRLTSDGELTYPDQTALIKWAETVVRDAEHIGDVRSTERRRRHYVTNGLDNYHEIALTVPNIDPWKTEDVTHFGDAGNGRAVVWTRFGETTLPNGEKVLVVDEVQSKRHDAGRKQGYADIRVQKSIDEAKKEWEQKEKELEEYKTSLDEKYGVPTTLKSPNATKEEIKQLKQLRAEAKAAREKWFDTRDQKGAYGIPDAPFEKNWLEVGMKRMLRYAAENGFDYVAWTNGEQQRERYSLAKLITSIGVNVPTMSTGRSVSLHYRGDEGPDFFFMEVDENGKIKNGQAKGRTLSEVVGKEVADQIMAVEDSATIESKDIRVGGEGLADLYDKMLPSFMNKYGKKWGVKVEDLELPNLGKSGYTMHSVPVTEEMKASVMEGQVMFRTTAITPEVQEEMDAISASAIVRGNYLKAPNGADTNLTPEQWAMVRTKAFKAWFGDWEKAARINKLRNSEPVVMTGNEFEGKYELNRDSAQKYILDELRDTYTIADTKERIKIVKKGAKKVTSHSMGNDAHIRSIAIIPEIIKSAIFITEMPADKTDAQYDSYRYYVCGLEYAGESYTVKMTVGVKNGDYYYDHTLTDIEKGKLLDMIESQQGVSREGFTPTENESEPSYALSDIKDKKLVSILQTNSSKVVDANGEPKVVYHGSNWRPLLEEPGKAQFFMQEGAMGKGAYFSDLYNEAEDYARLKYALHNDGEYVDSDFIYDNGYVTEAFLNIRNEEDILETYTQTYFVARNPSQIKSAIANTGEFSEENGDIRFRTSMELDQEFGAAWRDQQNEDGRHSTQVANTKSTYEKIGNWMKGAGLEGASILDASSGLGLGTQALREMGFQVDDVEPFPSENREAPTFASYDAIDGKYDVVISNAVLNVIPDDWRADVLHKMAAVVKDGGKIIINTRPASNISKQGVEGKTRITLDSPSEILVKRGDRIAAYQKGFTSEELASWIESELGEGWRVEKATKKNSGISGEGTAVVIKESEPRFRVTGTPTEDVVAEGVNLSKKDLANLAGDIFAALPEESRKKITDSLNGNLLGLQDAIMQIPVDLAIKENWNDEDKEMADVVAEQMTKAVSKEMTRPFSAPEALWTLYNAVNKPTDLVSEASRALVRRNLGFGPETLGMENQAREDVRFRTVNNASLNASTNMYNKGARNAWTRLKESFVDMNASVEEFVKSIEKASGKVAQGFENILLALNQQSSKGLAAMESYEQKFLKPMFDEIIDIMKRTGAKYETVVRYVILKHGLERNKKLAQRDAKAHYQEIYDDIIAKIKSMTDAQKRTYLTNAQLQEADAKAELARLKNIDQSTLSDEDKKNLKKEIKKAAKAVAEAEEHLKKAKKVQSMSEQEALDELQKIFDKIENGSDSYYQELRKNDYSGLTSMFYSQLGVYVITEKYTKFAFKSIP